MSTTVLVESNLFQDALEFVRQKGCLQARYDNFIGGQFLPPTEGRYYTDTSPINGKAIADIARSSPQDVEVALDAAHAAKRSWARLAVASEPRSSTR